MRGARRVLFDQTHHMANLYVEGPDAVKMVSYLSTNSYEKFPVDRAKQFAPTSYSGHVIGDGILFHLEQNKLVFVGRAPAANWMQFHGESGKFDVKVTMDDRSPMRPMGKAVTRSVWRFQIQGAEGRRAPAEAEWRLLRRDQVLQHGRHQDRRQDGPRAASRHGRHAGSRALGPVRRAGRDARRDPRGGQGSRPRAGRLACLLLEHARVGLDSLAASRRLHRRPDEGLPRVAAVDGV